MRLVEIIKNFGKFRRKRSPSAEEAATTGGYQKPTTLVRRTTSVIVGGHVNEALDEDLTLANSRNGSLDFIEAPTTVVQLSSDSPEVLSGLEDNEDEDEVDLPVESTKNFHNCKTSNISSFAVRSDLLVAAWRRLKRVKGVGILCALASVLFWSFNGLLIKLNDGYFGVHVLESLTISSFIVCIAYLIFIFSAYGRRRPTMSSSTSSITSFASTISTTSTASSLGVPTTKSKPIFSGSNRHPHHQLPATVDWTVILGVPGERWSLFLRCFLGTISLATFYTSYTYIPLSDATTIRFTSPVFIAAFAHFLVAEPFGLLQVVNSCTTLAGVVLIGRPSFLFGASSPSSNDNSTFSASERTNSSLMSSSTFFHFYAHLNGNAPEEGNVEGSSGSTDGTHTAIGLALALVSAISISVSMIAMRRMKRTPAALVIFWFSACNVVLGVLGLAVLGKWSVPPGLTSWAIIGSTTLCNGFDQLFVTLALKLENAGAVAVIQALCVVLSFLFSIAILHETLYWTSALGGAFIFLSVLVLGFAKMATEWKSSSNCRGKKEKGDGNGVRRRRIFQLNLATAASSLSLKSKSFDIISSVSSRRASSIPTSNPANSFAELGSFVSTRPPLSLQHRTLPNSSSSSTSDSGLCRVGGEPYLLRVAPINGDRLQRHQQEVKRDSLDGNNNVS